MFHSIEEIKTNGFDGFITIQELLNNKNKIPNTKGIYMVLYVSNSIPVFLNIGSGPSLYKKKDNPNVSTELLGNCWVKNSKVIYIGKAGGKNSKGEETRATLRKRLGTYLSFGQGKDVRHWGGRYIWQIKDPTSLIVCWKSTPFEDPRDIENKLILEFKRFYQEKRPFANLRD